MDIQFQIVESLGILSESKSGWKCEVNMVSWNGAEPKFDIRSWSPDHSKMGKGITLNESEVQALIQILSKSEEAIQKQDNTTSIKESAELKSSPSQEERTPGKNDGSVENSKAIDSVNPNASTIKISEEEISDEMVEKRLKKIARGLPYLDDKYTWDAFRYPPQIDEFFVDNKDYLDFCRDAAKAATLVKYDLSYLEIRQLAENTYRDLLNKYQFPKDLVQPAVHEMLVEFFIGRSEVFIAIAENENYQGDIPELADDDMDTIDMAHTFAILPEQPDVKEYLKSIDVTYDYDQLHMVTWFSVQVTLGDGNYSRQVPNHSAKTTYNRLLNPYSLLWIAAALGVDRETVIAAAKAAEAKSSFAGKCGVIRKAIPFNVVRDLAKQKLDAYIEEISDSSSDSV